RASVRNFDAQLLGQLDDGPAHAVELQRLAHLQVLQHRGLVVADADSRLQPPLERYRKLDFEGCGNGRALLEDRAYELDHLRQGAQLAERGSGQGGHRVEGDVPDQLQPDVVANSLLDWTLK